MTERAGARAAFPNYGEKRAVFLSKFRRYLSRFMSDILIDRITDFLILVISLTFL